MTASSGTASAENNARWALPVLLLVVCISLVGFGVVLPLLPFYATLFHAPAWLITLMFSTFSLGQFAGESFWGRLSDRIGRRPVLLITILASAIGYVALAYSPTIWIALSTRLIAGFFAGNVSTIQGYVADVTPPERRASRLGYVGAAFGLGYIAGPAVGGWLGHPEIGGAGFRPPLLAAAGLCLVAGAGLFLFVRESRSAEHRGRPHVSQLAAFRDATSHPVIRRLLAVTLVSFIAFSAVQSTIGLWGQHRFGWGPHQVALISVLGGVSLVLSQGLLTGHATRRLGEVTTLMLALMLSSLTLLVQAVTPWPALAIAGYLVISTSFSICQPAVTSLISRSSRAEHQGAMLGVNAATGALARITGPIISGFLFMAADAGPFLFAALGMIPAAWMAYRAGRALHEHRMRI